MWFHSSVVKLQRRERERADSEWTGTANTNSINIIARWGKWEWTTERKHIESRYATVVRLDLCCARSRCVCLNWSAFFCSGSGECVGGLLNWIFRCLLPRPVSQSSTHWTKKRKKNRHIHTHTHWALKRKAKESVVRHAHTTNEHFRQTTHTRSFSLPFLSLSLFYVRHILSLAYIHFNLQSHKRSLYRCKILKPSDDLWRCRKCELQSLLIHYYFAHISPLVLPHCIYIFSVSLPSSFFISLLFCSCVPNRILDDHRLTKFIDSLSYFFFLFRTVSIQSLGNFLVRKKRRWAFVSNLKWLLFTVWLRAKQFSLCNKRIWKFGYNPHQTLRWTST